MNKAVDSYSAEWHDCKNTRDHDNKQTTGLTLLDARTNQIIQVSSQKVQGV